MEKTIAHYNRTMNHRLVEEIQANFPWLIHFVEMHPELDFQTGQNKGESWFQIYRGTGRLLSFKMGAGERCSLRITADKYYKGIGSKFGIFDINCQPFTEKSFQSFLDAVSSDPHLSKYYTTGKERHEGYFQNLIARRYTLFCQPNDPFIIIDKELVIGFDHDIERTEWNKEISESLRNLDKKVRSKLTSEHPYPSKIKDSYGEFDFMALDWEGNFIIMELKQADPQKTSLSPFQTKYYVLQFEKLIKENKDEVCEAVRKMIEQKIDMGLIKLPKGKQLPDTFNANIKSCVIVGDDHFSEEICYRYHFVKEIVNPEMKAFTCEEDGTIVPSKCLK